MLVLSRHENEAIVIDGGRIIVTVVEIKKGVVRLGVQADRAVVVDREELHEAKKAARRTLE
ncbi:MAG: carbon storage regulator [Candidatus Pacebacteria bacterium]|nr:carbon storage regulator [Candidatus Paceibacterota bacterium]